MFVLSETNIQALREQGLDSGFYDRNNIQDLKQPIDSAIELTDDYYLLVINMKTTAIEFRVSGQEEPPPPEPEPDPVPDTNPDQGGEDEGQEDSTTPVDNTGDGTNNGSDTEQELPDENTDSESNNSGNSEVNESVEVDQAAILEYYAGGPLQSGSSVSSSKHNHDKNKTSEETQIVLTVAITVTVLIVLMMVFYCVADSCRRSDLIQKDKQQRGEENIDSDDEYEDSVGEDLVPSSADTTSKRIKEIGSPN